MVAILWFLSFPRDDNQHGNATWKLMFIITSFWSRVLKLMKQRTSNPSFYFPAEVGIPKVEGLVQHYAASPPLSYNRPCLPVNDLF